MHEFETLQSIDANEFVARVIMAKTKVAIVVVSCRVNSSIISKQQRVFCASSHLLSRETKVGQLSEGHDLLHARTTKLPIGIVTSDVHRAHTIKC